MTSTNDGKDVKSNQISGHKSKTYYIELYKSLEKALSSDSPLEERTRHVCEAWRRVYSLYQHAATSTHPHLLSWLQRHTANTVLQSKWAKSKNEHAKLTDAIDALVAEATAASAGRQQHPWEQTLIQRAAWFRKAVENPWDNPVLKSLINPDSEPVTDQQVLEWLISEHGIVLVTRLQRMAGAGNCDDLALALAAAVMDRARAATPHRADERAEEKEEEKDDASFVAVLEREASFTSEEWDMLTDIELVLLFKTDKRQRCIELAKLTPLRNGFKMVERLRKRLETSPRDKKLWKHAKEVATIVTQVLIARCMVLSSCSGAGRDVLYWSARSLAHLVEPPRLRAVSTALAAPAATARHLHTFCAALSAECKELKTDVQMKPFICELYVRAITAGMNELEQLKLNAEKESDARLYEQTLAGWFTQLGGRLTDSVRLRAECALTAFSVHPSRKHYERVANTQPPHKLSTTLESTPSGTTSEYGSWANDSRTQSNLVKTSETLQLKQSQQHQANVLSTAILTEGEALGLEPELCQDLAVLLSGPRVKTLSWDMDRDVLLENCRSYLEKTHGGTRAVTTELRFLNLDPSAYRHLPEEDDDENDVYYGIEKGYEHEVQFEEPEEIWQNAFFDPEHTESANDSEVERTGNKKSNYDEDEDPLSTLVDAKKEKKKRAKEKLKEPRKKKTQKRDDSQDGSKERRKDTDKKTKKERKKDKSEQPTTGSLTSLLGMKVTTASSQVQDGEKRVRKKKERRRESTFSYVSVTDSDYDSQGKSSQISDDPNVLVDGVFSMDELKSPERLSFDKQKPIDNTKTTIKSSKNPVIKNIKTRPMSSPTVTTTSSDSDAARAKSPYLTPNQLAHRHVVNPVVKSSLHKLLQFRRNQNKMRAAARPQPAHTPTVIPTPPKTLVGMKVYNPDEVPKVYESKYKKQCKQLETLSNDVDKLFKEVSEYKSKTAFNETAVDNNLQSQQNVYSQPRQHNSSMLSAQHVSNDIQKLCEYAAHSPVKPQQTILNQSLNSVIQRNYASPTKTSDVRSHGQNLTPQKPIITYHPLHKSMQNLTTEKQDLPKKPLLINDPNYLNQPVKGNASQLSPRIISNTVIKPPSQTATAKDDCKSQTQNNLHRTHMSNAAQNINNQMTKLKSDVIRYGQNQLSSSMQNITEGSRLIHDGTRRNIVTPSDMLHGKASHAKQSNVISHSDALHSAQPLRSSGLVQNPPRIDTGTSQKSEHDFDEFLKELVKSNNAGSNDPEKKVAVALNKDVKMSPVQTPSTSAKMTNVVIPQSAKQPLQQKKTENALNTFSRLSYMHKNKQNENKVNLTDAVTLELNKKIMEHKISKAKCIKHELTISRVGMTNPNTQDPDKTIKRVDHSGSRLQKKCPVLSSMLESSGSPNMQTYSSTNTSHYSYENQPKREDADLLLLLRNQAIVKPNINTLETSTSDGISHQTPLTLHSHTNVETLLSPSQQTLVGTKVKNINMLDTCARETTSEDNEWKRVMDAIRAQKTEPLGPNALDLALKKGQRRHSQGSARTSGRRVSMPGQGTSQNKPDTKKRENHSSKSSSTSRKPSTEKHSQIPTRPRAADIMKNTPPETFNRLEVQNKHYSSNSTKEVSHASEIPNSDYDMLDDLIDDDLRQELGEISSDEEAYSVQSAPSVKGKSHRNIPKSNANVCKVGTTSRGKINKNQNHLNMAHTNVRSVANTASPSDYPNMIINNTSHPLVTHVEHNSTAIISETAQQYASSTTIITNQVAQNTANNILTHIEANQYVNNMVPTNVIIASVPQPAPVVVIRQDLVYDPYPTIRIHESQMNAELCAINQNVFAVNAAPNIAVYQTTQFAAPVINPIIIGNATTSTNVTNATAMRNEHVTPEDSFVKEDLNMPDEDSISLETALRLSDALDETPQPSNLDFNMNRNCESKVLSQVYENHTNDVDKDRLREDDTHLKTEQDAERIKLKRHSLINRKISHAGVYPPITLTYTPLCKKITLGKLLQQESLKNGTVKPNLKLITNATNDIAVVTESVKSPTSEARNENIESIDQASSAKENQKSCRRIWLRSSNNIPNKKVSPVKRPRTPLKRKTVKLQIKGTTIKNTTITNLENENKGGMKVTKRTSNRILNKNKPDASEPSNVTESQEIIAYDNELIDFEKELNSSIVLKSTAAMLEAEGESIQETKSSAPAVEQLKQLEDNKDIDEKSQFNKFGDNKLEQTVLIEKLKYQLGDQLVIKSTSVKTCTEKATVITNKKNMINDSVEKQSSAISNVDNIKVIAESAATAASKASVFVDGTKKVKPKLVLKIVKKTAVMHRSSLQLDDENDKVKSVVVNDQKVIKQKSAAGSSIDDQKEDKQLETTIEGSTKQRHSTDAPEIRKDETIKNNSTTSTTIPNIVMTKETPTAVKSNRSVISLNADTTLPTTNETKTNTETDNKQPVQVLQQKCPNVNIEPVSMTDDHVEIIETSKAVAPTEVKTVHAKSEILKSNPLNQAASKAINPREDDLLSKENEVLNDKSVDNQNVPIEKEEVSKHLDPQLSNLIQSNLNSKPETESSNLENIKKPEVQSVPIKNASGKSISDDKNEQKPASYMRGDIKIEEIPLDEPNKKFVRISLPNGKVFKATIFGKMLGDFDCLFAQPTMRALLAGSVNNDDKRYTVNYKQVQRTFKDDPNKKDQQIHDLHIKESRTESALKPVDTVNLVSDDEDEVPTRTFNTEFGKYATNLDQETIAKHQKKFDQRCHVKMLGEDIFKSNRTKPKSKTLPSEKTSLLTRNKSKLLCFVPTTTSIVPKDETDPNAAKLTQEQGTPTDLLEQINTPIVPNTTDVIEIDDSSNDGIDDQAPDPEDKTNNEPVKIAASTNLLLQDLGVGTDNVKLPPLPVKTTVNLKSALLKDLGILPAETPVIDITENDEDEVSLTNNIKQPTCDESKLETDVAQNDEDITITENQKRFDLKKCVVTLFKCEELIQKYELKNKMKDCYVKMERLNNSILQTVGASAISEETSDKEKDEMNEDNAEDFIEFDVDEPSSSPQLSRCPSLSILNNWDDDSQPALESPYCTSPVMEIYDTLVQLRNKIKIELARESTKLSSSACDSEWTMTKFGYNTQELLLRSSHVLVTENQVFLTGTGNVDSSEKLIMTVEIPKLLTITLKFLEDNPHLLYQQEHKLRNKSIPKIKPTSNKLKRKTEVVGDNVASKVLKLGALALNRLNSSFTFDIFKEVENKVIQPVPLHNVENNNLTVIKPLKYESWTVGNIEQSEKLSNTIMQVQHEETLLIVDSPISQTYNRTKEDCKEESQDSGNLIDITETQKSEPAHSQSETLKQICVDISTQESSNVPVDDNITCVPSNFGDFDQDVLVENREVTSGSLLSEYIESTDKENKTTNNSEEAVNGNFSHLNDIASFDRAITEGNQNLTSSPPLSDQTRSGYEKKQVEESVACHSDIGMYSHEPQCDTNSDDNKQISIFISNEKTEIDDVSFLREEENIVASLPNKNGSFQRDIICYNRKVTSPSLNENYVISKVANELSITVCNEEVVHNLSEVKEDYLAVSSAEIECYSDDVTESNEQITSSSLLNDSARIGNKAEQMVINLSTDEAANDPSHLRGVESAVTLPSKTDSVDKDVTDDNESMSPPPLSDNTVTDDEYNQTDTSFKNGKEVNDDDLSQSKEIHNCMSCSPSETDCYDKEDTQGTHVVTTPPPGSDNTEDSNNDEPRCVNVSGNVGNDDLLHLNVENSHLCAPNGTEDFDRDVTEDTYEVISLSPLTDHTATEEIQISINGSNLGPATDNSHVEEISNSYLLDEISMDDLPSEAYEVEISTQVHEDVDCLEILVHSSQEIISMPKDDDTSEINDQDLEITSPDFIDNKEIAFNYHDYTKRPKKKQGITANSISGSSKFINKADVLTEETYSKKYLCPKDTLHCEININDNYPLKSKPECKYELIQDNDSLTVNITTENGKDDNEVAEIFVSPNTLELDTVDASCSNNADDIDLKGFELEDVYVFPLSQEGSNNSNVSNDTLSQELNSEAMIDSAPNDIHDIDFHLKEPEVTYSRKRKKSMRAVRVTEKRYRKGKNIDCSKQTQFSMIELAYSKEYKRLLEYWSSVKFSYSRPFHEECFELEDLISNWSTNSVCSDIANAAQLTCSATADENLFIDLEKFGSYQPDPATQTFVEEISYEYNKNDAVQEDPHSEASETKFNMGFGEGSGRVIQILKKECESNISAATLSDVKQSQPVFKSVEHDNCNNVTNNYDQMKKIRQHVHYTELRDKVRQFFKKSTLELKSDWIKQNTKDLLYPEEFPFDLCSLEYVKPFPTNAIVQVVQVGQLPVSAAAQNPVTCDPRVTQVSDASPSQCSVDNSPNDDSQSEIKTEYTELTTADLTLPLQEYAQQNQGSHASQDSNVELTEQTISLEMEITAEESPEIKQELPEIKEEKSNSSDTELHTFTNEKSEKTDYSFENNTSKCDVGNVNYDSSEQNSSEKFPQHRQQNGTTEKTDQIAHAMNAAGITTTPETVTSTRAHALVNILSQKIRQGSVNTTQTTTNTYSKTINAMALQQALAQILPPPLNQTGSSENGQAQSTPVGPQVLHIVQGKNATGNQITLVDNSQQSVISTPNATQVLHIVQNKNATSGQASNGTLTQQANSFSGLSLVDAGLQQGGNQLLHIVNTGNQKTASPGQLLKRVNLLTNLTNVQGSNEQKMVQFVCKSADGKAIQLNAPHQRSMVLRLQPIETPNVQTPPAKPAESQELSPSPTGTASSKESASQQEIKSRSIYEENYAKFIQNSSSKTPSLEKSTSLPKFNQAFGKPVFQEGSQKQSEGATNNSHLPPGNTNSENSECPANDSAINLEHMGNISSPPLLIRKPVVTTQSQSNIVQQIKQTIAPMNIQTMHGGVIYTRQIPVNIGGGQTINLITVPSTELINDDASKTQAQTSQGEIEPSIIKIVPQSQNTTNTEGSQGEINNHLSGSNDNAQTPQPQPVLTQMRIKLPMLSKAPQMVPGARVVRPSFFQIQRNVIGGANQPVYQQLVLTAAPPLGQQTIRLPSQATRSVKVPSESQSSSSESQMSSSTLEQLREFDMVLEQVKERSTSTPSANSNNSSFKIHTSSSDTTDGNASSNCSTESAPQVLYSIGNNQALNVTYVNRKTAVTTPTTSTYVRSPDSSGIADSPTSSTHVHIPHTVTTDSSPTEMSSQSKPAKVGSKSKSRPKSTSNPPNTLKLSSSVPPKTSSQKPLEDEQTTQRILYILAEYKEQVENSPDKDKPAPRRRSNPPSNPGSSKRKKSSSSRRSGTRDMSPVHGEDTCRTMGSEDSSCGTSQGDCTESCLDSHSPQDSPRKVARKITFDQDLTVTQPRPQPQRNVIVADGQTITVARGTTGKPATAVLMPANYILPVSMVKGGQQIAIVTNRGPKLLTVGGEGGATNALLLQRLIGPAGLKPVLARPGVRHVRLPTAALHNLQAFNLATATTVQPPDSTASPTPGPTPPELVDTRATSSPWTDRDDVKPERSSSPEGSEPWNLPSADAQDYTYEETVRTDNMDRTVLDPIPDRYSPDMEAQRIFDKMFDVDSKKAYAVDSHDDSPRCAYDIDPSDDDKAYQVVQKKDGSQRQHRLAHVSAAALRHKYAILEHELRLQKSLSEECEDLGVDSPSASELFPEAELLFANSPAHEHNQEHHSHTPQPLQSSIPQPDIDDQIATDHLIPRGIDVSLGLGDVGTVVVSEDGSATIALDQEEFARSHPNTTFHSEPTDGEVQPFTITGLKGRHITSTIFHSNSAPATVLMTAPQATVISQAPEHSAKYGIENMIHSMPSSHNNDINLSSVLVKDDGLTRFDNILTDSRELHLTNTASAIVHSSANATQVIRRVCYEDDKRERDARYLIDEPDNLIAGDDAKMIAEDSSRDATLESMADVDDDRSSPERHAELFWESNSASERSESRRPLDFSSDSDKCCKSPSFDETNSTDSSGVGTHMRLDSVIKEARGRERSGSADGSSADDTHPPLRTYPPKRLYHPLEGETERSLSGKTRAGERSPDSLEVRRRASGRGVVKRGCHCCNGSPAPPRPKKPRQRKPTLDFNTNN